MSSLSSQAFGVYRQLWTNLNSNLGATLAALTNTAYNPNWPNNPAASYTHVFTNFETELNTGMDYYGQRLRTFVVPPMNGYYTFWIASDDTSLLLLSSNENPANEKPIASVTSWTPWRDFTDGNQPAIRADLFARRPTLLSGSAHGAGRGRRQFDGAMGNYPMEP